MLGALRLGSSCACLQAQRVPAAFAALDSGICECFAQVEANDVLQQHRYGQNASSSGCSLVCYAASCGKLRTGVGARAVQAGTARSRSRAQIADW